MNPRHLLPLLVAPLLFAACDGEGGIFSLPTPTPAPTPVPAKATPTPKPWMWKEYQNPLDPQKKKPGGL